MTQERLILITCTECGSDCYAAWNPETQEFVWACINCNASGDLEPPDLEVP